MRCWSSHERLVDWLALRKGGGIAAAFDLVHLLSRRLGKHLYLVVDAGRTVEIFCNVNVTVEMFSIN